MNRGRRRQSLIFILKNLAENLKNLGLSVHVTGFPVYNPYEWNLLKQKEFSLATILRYEIGTAGSDIK